MLSRKKTKSDRNILWKKVCNFIWIWNKIQIEAIDKNSFLGLATNKQTTRSTAHFSDRILQILILPSPFRYSHHHYHNRGHYII